MSGASLAQLDEHLTRWHNTYSCCLPELLRLRGATDRRTWLRLLGIHWSKFDNVKVYLPQLKRGIGRRSRIVELMTAEELIALDAMPEQITIYRGCGADNMLGISWSTDRAVASRFAFLNYYRAEVPMLLTATVARGDVVAVKLGRGEATVITLKAVIVNEEILIEPLMGSSVTAAGQREPLQTNTAHA